MYMLAKYKKYSPFCSLVDRYWNSYIRWKVEILIQMRWLLPHTVCFTFVQWAHFMGRTVMHMFILQYHRLLAPWVPCCCQSCKTSDNTIDWEQVKKYTCLFMCIAPSVTLTRYAACLNTQATSNEGIHTLCRFRCALFVVLNQGHLNLGQARLWFMLTHRNTQWEFFHLCDVALGN